MNNSTPLSNLSVTKDDFLKSGWEQVLSSSAEKDCWSYSSLFGEKSKEAEKAGDARKGQVFTLLIHVTSMMLKPDSKNEPFAPMMVLQNSRSAIVDDFTEEHLSLFKELVSEISDAELRARLADILWVRKRDFHMAELAVDSYLESAEVLEHPEKWTLAMDRIERALRLSAQIGKTGSRFQKVISFMERLLEKFNGEDPLFFSAKLMGLLLEYHQGEPSKYARLAEKAAIRAEAVGNWHLARNYWQIKAKWHQLGKEEELQRDAMVRLAETYVQEAESVRERPGQGYMIASHHIQSAIQTLGRVNGTKERRDELHRVLLDYEKKSVTELKAISVNVDLSEMAKKAMEHVKGLRLHDALLKFAFLGSPRKIADLEKEVQEHTTNYPLQHSIPSVGVNSAGKVVSRKPSMLSSADEEIDAAKKAEMYSLAASHQSFHVFGVIEPARHQINLEHNCRVSDFLQLVSNNPFVPEGRENLFAKGLHAGLTGDFITAAHLLVPQLENSLRYVLEQRGVRVSGLDDEGIQDEFLLDRILYMPELIQILGEDQVFELKGLLVERYGTNFRNLLAHGLLNQDRFYAAESIYLWWLTLRLCCIPILSKLKDNENASQEENNE